MEEEEEAEAADEEEEEEEADPIDAYQLILTRRTSPAYPALFAILSAAAPRPNRSERTTTAQRQTARPAARASEPKGEGGPVHSERKADK